MLRLPSPTHAWVTLAAGVRVLMRPALRPEIEAARHWAAAETRQQLADVMARIADRLGQEAADVARPDDTTIQHAEAGHTVAALGLLLIEAWEGPDGPPTPDAVRALLAQPDQAAAFLPAALGLAEAVTAEGNASAPAPNGMPAAGANTAVPVPVPAGTVGTA